MERIKGIAVTLYEKEKVGTDLFNNPIYSETAVVVENVLVGSPTTDDITTATSLYGRKAVYTLGIPKEDTHNWENVKVEFFGEVWRTFGLPVKGIDDLVPTEWNEKVMVERYEG